LGRAGSSYELEGIADGLSRRKAHHPGVEQRDLVAEPIVADQKIDLVVAVEIACGNELR
jgi:hypothetical protein